MKSSAAGERGPSLNHWEWRHFGRRCSLSIHWQLRGPWLDRCEGERESASTSASSPSRTASRERANSHSTRLSTQTPSCELSRGVQHGRSKSTLPRLVSRRPLLALVADADAVPPLVLVRVLVPKQSEREADE